MEHVFSGPSTRADKPHIKSAEMVSVIDPVHITYDPRRASQKRLETAALECSKLNNITYFSKGLNILVSHKYKVTVTRIPKAGSTTWQHVMHEIDPVSGDPESRRRLSSLAPPEFDQYVRGVFFREPLERLVSYYHYHICPPGPVPTLYFHRYYKYMRKGHVNATMNNKPYLTFIQFVQLVLDYDQIPSQSYHWRHQYLLSRICEFNYTFIGHMDHLAQDAPYFMNLAVGDSFHYPEVHTTRGESRFRETISTLSQKLIDQLIDHYKLDYKILGFEIPNFSKK
ncbi:carbohydrate sulfotransferase 10-like [Saccoglossus kowalevskii]|uniref:Carbohydrate sulfotransferase n=1 Tax=Saccoglossus kowalevskii TaxID=10224 RepID=A0ABM0M0U1_SACKO|nr:PREDICTED: carbohydrate sulfotransferase 10-like [Saccoglossus kowalevskii]